MSALGEDGARPRRGRAGLGVGLLLLGLAVAGGLAWRLASRASPDDAPEEQPIGSAATSPVVPGAPGLLDGHDLLLVTLDTTRADRLGCYGNADIATPHLDELARTGVRFEDALAVASTTLPTHASILTGLAPGDHGVRANGLFRLEDDVVTLAERLAAAGFRTGAVVSAFVLDAQFGLAQGFEVYDDDLSDAATPGDRHYAERHATATTDHALRVLEGFAGQRSFLWVHYFDPHHEYAPPAPFDRAGNPYDGEIAYVDAELGRLLAAVDREHTLVAVIGDHGEGLGFHHEYTHGYLTYDTTLHVPFLLNAPGKLPGNIVCTRPTSQVDLAPLVLALLGLADGPEAVRPFAPVGSGDVRTFETLTGTYEFGWEPIHGVVVGDLKYLHGSDPELYDRARDPGELENLAARRPEDVNRLRGLVERVFAAELAATPLPTNDLVDQDLSALQALGYFGGGVDGGGSSAQRVPPRTRMPYLHRVETALAPNLAPQQAVAALKAVIAEEPDCFAAWNGLGTVYRRVGALEPAAEALERCLALRPGLPAATTDLALVRTYQKRPADAARLLAPIVATWPALVRARSLHGTALAQLGRFDEACDELATAFTLDPAYPNLAVNLAQAARRADRVAEVATQLEQRRDEAPEAVEAALEVLR